MTMKLFNINRRQGASEAAAASSKGVAPTGTTRASRRPRLPVAHALSLVLLTVAPLHQQYGGAHAQMREMGDPSCPCISNLEELPPIDPLDRSPEVIELLGDAINSTYYGIGCSAHSRDTPQCTESDCTVRKELVPAPLGCDLSWCNRQWCYVDPTNCTLLNKRSQSTPHSDRFYSYATCGDADAFTANTRFATLEGKVFRIGLNANSGGWLGSYRDDGVHFQGPISKWTGLSVDFVIKAAFRGKFLLNLTQPPDFLRERSKEFFGTESQFDYCVYATSLGYLDMCVAQYTITDQRASTTDWLLLGSSGIYLVVDTDDQTQSSLQFFLSSVSTIFQPFTAETWLFIVFFVIPVLGCLMIVHESGKGGSTYPREEAVVVTDDKTGESVLKKIPVPWYRTVIKSIYIAFLAVLQQSYEQSVLTIGAMLNLLGISFFILTIVAVYTANLAAILTQNVQEPRIDSLEDAVRAGYRLCSERKNMEAVTYRYPNLDPKIFVADPIELGGDGLPGFNCQQCAPRTRVFDFLDPVLADEDPRYCHAAIAPSEDLDVMQAASLHCNKTLVGSPAQMTQTGIPIFEEVSPQLISYFLKLKNDGQYDAALLANKPKGQCPVEERGEGSALTLAQLSGIWVVSFGFAFAGLFATWFHSWHKKRMGNKTDFQVRKVHKRDQRGGKIDALGIEDSWMTANPQRSGSNSNVTRHEGSAAGSIRLLHPEGSALSVINADESSNRSGKDRDASWVLRKRGNTTASSSSKAFDGEFLRRRPPSGAQSDTSSKDRDLTLKETCSESGVESKGGETNSVLEAREKLLKIIDEQANIREEEPPGPATGQMLGDGSVELMTALDELAFVPSFSKDDSNV
jgi:hypothetical protein